MAQQGKFSAARQGPAAPTAGSFAHTLLAWCLPLLYCLISSCFYLRTYDSAQVKITLMQMGGAGLLALWLIRLIEAGKSAFSREDLVSLSPFLAYLAYGIFSFIHSPYNMASVDFFLRHFFFMTAALIIIYEFDGLSADRLTRILIWTAWIAVGYGFLQFIDTKWFPVGVGKGIDPFVWRHAFGPRVFSTYGNPNFFADFLVIVFPMILMRFIRTRAWNLILLMILLLVDLIMTGTKGAWVGFAMVLFFFGVIAFAFFPRQIESWRKPMLAVLALGILAFGGVVAKDISKRWVSINFRLFTWEGTWEMVMTHPIIGSGVGSFPPLYPAFRRPPIFHIEGKHNTETDHAEDEYIEQLFDNGLLGFGIFLWMVLSTFTVGFRSLRQLTTTLAARDGTPHPRAYDLVGYLVALLGMLGHNFFDVSLRFVSSGIYLGLLPGMIVNLSRGRGLYELHGTKAAAAGSGPPVPPAAPAPEEGAGPGIIRVLSELLVWPARAAAWGGLGYMVFRLCKEYNELQGPVGRMAMGGEILQWWLAWAVFLACVVPMSLFFARLVLLSQTPLVPTITLAMLYPLDIFWGYFKADVHHNIAIYFSKERQWDQALHHYFQVEKLNPNFVMSMYFMGNVYNDRFNMARIYNPAWGDKDDKPRDDYERAIDSYDKVRRLAPNYVQHHHQVGVLHMKRAEWAMNQGRAEEAAEYHRRAMVRFKLYRAIDPVFAPNYFRMGQLLMIQKRYQEAVDVYQELIAAPFCQVEPSLISKGLLRRTILSYQGYVEEPGHPHPVHRHETAEAYLNLGNAYFMLEKYPEGEKAYRRGLALEPANELLKRNLGVLYSKAREQGRLKAVAPELSSPTYFGPQTGFEVIEKR